MPWTYPTTLREPWIKGAGATVGTLRAQAPTEDLTYLEGDGIKGYDEGKRPTMGELAQRMAEAYSSESWIGEVESRVK